jgi:hypothetical protein
MKGFVGVTDNDWSAFLSQQTGKKGTDLFFKDRRRSLSILSMTFISHYLITILALESGHFGLPFSVVLFTSR